MTRIGSPLGTRPTFGLSVSGFASTPVQRGGGRHGLQRHLRGHQQHLLEPRTNGATYGSALSYIPGNPLERLLRQRAARSVPGLFRHPTARAACATSLDAKHSYLVSGCRQRRPKRLRDRSAVHLRRRRRELRGMAQALVAVGCRATRATGCATFRTSTLFTRGAGRWGHCVRVYCDSDPANGGSCSWRSQHVARRGPEGPRSPRR